MNILLSKKMNFDKILLMPLTVVKIIYCIVKVESRECEILKTAFKKEDASRHDIMNEREGG